MHVEHQYNRFELALMETQGVSGNIHHARLDDPDSVRQLRQRSRHFNRNHRRHHDLLKEIAEKAEAVECGKAA